VLLNAMDDDSAARTRTPARPLPAIPAH